MLINLPGDDDLMARLESGEELNPDERFRVEEITRDKILQQIGSENLKEFTDQYVKQEKVSYAYVDGLREGLKYAITGLFGLPKYAAQVGEDQTIGIIPIEAIEQLQNDLTILSIAYENQLSYDELKQLMRDV